MREFDNLRKQADDLLRQFPHRKKEIINIKLYITSQEKYYLSIPREIRTENTLKYIVDNIKKRLQLTKPKEVTIKDVIDVEFMHQKRKADEAEDAAVATAAFYTSEVKKKEDCEKKLNDCKEENKTLANEKIKLEQEKNDLQTQLDNLTTEKKNLQTQLDNLNTEKKNLQVELNTCLSKQENLEKEKSGLSKQIDENNTKINELNDKINQLNNELTKRGQELTQLKDVHTKAINNLRNVIDDLRNQLNDCKEEIDRLTKENDELKKQLKKCNDDLKYCQEQQSKLEEEISGCRKNLQEEQELSKKYQQDYKTLYQNMEETMNRLQKQIADIDFITSKLHNITEGEPMNNGITYDNDIEKLSELIIKLKTQLSKIETSMNQCKQELRNCNDEKSALLNEKKTYENELQKLTDENERLQNQIKDQSINTDKERAEAIKQYNQNTAHINELNNKIAELSQTIKAKDITISDSEKNIEQVKFDHQVEIEKLTTEIKTLTKSLYNCNTDSSQLKKRITTLEGQRDSVHKLQANMEKNLKEQLRKLSSEKKSLENNLDKMTKAVSFQDGAIVQNNEEIKQLQARLNECNENIIQYERELEKNKETHEIENLALQNEIQSCNEKVKIRESENDEKEKRIASLLIDFRGCNQNFLDAQSKIQSLENERESLINKNTAEITRLNNMVAKLQNEKEQLDKTLQEKTEALLQNIKILNEARQSDANKDDILDDLRGTVAKYEREKKHLENLVSRKNAEIEKIKKECDEKISGFAMLRSDLDAKIIKCNNMQVKHRDELQKKETELKELQDILKKNNNEQKKLNSTISELEGQIKKMKSDYEKIINGLNNKIRIFEEREAEPVPLEQWEKLINLNKEYTSIMNSDDHSMLKISKLNDLLGKIPNPERLIRNKNFKDLYYKLRDNIKATIQRLDKSNVVTGQGTQSECVIC